MDLSIPLHALLKHSKLNHHIPGRLRIKYSKNITNHVQISELKELKEVLTGSGAIHDIRINATGFTAIIQYDPALIAPALWGEVFETHEEGKIKEVLNLTLPESVS